MKTKFTLLVVLLTAVFSLRAQQIPNNSFETWSSSYQPTGWTTVDALYGSPFGFTFKDTSVFSDGAASIKLVSDTIAGVPVAGVVPAFVSTGTATYSPGQPVNYTGIPFPYKPDTLSFDYKYTTPGSDSALVVLTLTKLHVPVLGVAGKLMKLPAGPWGRVSVLITADYISNTTPDSLLLQFFSNSSQVGVLGSVLHVDNIHFGYAAPSAIHEVSGEVSITVYPNPTSDVLNIACSKDLAGNHMEIFNLTGQVVINAELTANRLNLGSLANGTYIYRITDKEGITVSQNKLVILK